MEIISFIKLFTILVKTLIWLVFPHSKPMQLSTNGKFVLSFIPLQTVFEDVLVPDWFVVLFQQLFHVQVLLASATETIFPSNQSDNNQIVRIFIFFIFIFSWIKDYSIVLISELRSAGSNSVLCVAISSFISSPLWVLRSVMLSFEIVATMSVFVCPSLRVAGR